MTDFTRRTGGGRTSRDPAQQPAWPGRLQAPCAAASSASPPRATLRRAAALPGAPPRIAPTRWTGSTPTSTSGPFIPMSALPFPSLDFPQCYTSLINHPSLHAEGPAPAHPAACEPAQLVLLSKRPQFSIQTVCYCKGSRLLPAICVMLCVA